MISIRYDNEDNSQSMICRSLAKHLKPVSTMVLKINFFPAGFLPVCGLYVDAVCAWPDIALRLEGQRCNGPTVVRGMRYRGDGSRQLGDNCNQCMHGV